MIITDMRELDNAQIRQAAQILADSIPLGWADLGEALAEIDERIIPENTLLAATHDDEVIGWGGILPQYDGNVWELHPLCVREELRGRGIGRQIISALEDAARARAGLTIIAWADDEKPGGETSLANTDLYSDLPIQLAGFKAGTHQGGFYIKCGYTLLGVIPDANGEGKPDICFGKKL